MGHYPRPMAERAAIFVGSTMGDTWDAAERIASRLGSTIGAEVPCLEVESVDIRLLEQHDPVIVGCSTWDIGQLQTSWERRFVTAQRARSR